MPTEEEKRHLPDNTVATSGQSFIAARAHLMNLHTSSFIGLNSFFLLLLLLGSTATAQTIYTTVLGNQNYVVGSSTLRSGLFVSYDGATTWRHIGPENLKAYSMDGVDSSRGRVLYIAAGNGVHRSTDYGQHWKIVTDWRMTEVLDVKVDQGNPNFVYAATAWGFRRSTDGGDTWENPEGLLNERYCYRLELSGSGDSIIAVGESSLAISTDRGTSWTLTPLPPSPRFLLSPSLLPEVEAFNAAYKRQEENKDCGIRRLAVPVWSGIPQSFYDVAAADSGLMIGASEKGGMVTGEDSCLAWVQWGWQEATHAAAYVPKFRLWLFGTFGSGMVIQKVEKEAYGKPDFFTREFALEGSQIWRIVVKNYTVPVEAGHEH